MEFQFSKRAESFQPNIFNILNEKRQALVESGKKIYNMSVGTPDFPPAQHVLDVVSEAAKNPEEYKSLVVRVAGYSALFNDLEPKTQDDIIERTEHNL